MLLRIDLDGARGAVAGDEPTALVDAAPRLGQLGAVTRRELEDALGEAILDLVAYVREAVHAEYRGAGGERVQPSLHRRQVVVRDDGVVVLLPLGEKLEDAEAVAEKPLEHL